MDIKIFWLSYKTLENYKINKYKCQYLFCFFCERLPIMRYQSWTMLVLWKYHDKIVTPKIRRDISKDNFGTYCTYNYLFFNGAHKCRKTKGMAREAKKKRKQGSISRKGMNTTKGQICSHIRTTKKRTGKEKSCNQ